jgi:DNA-binding CsgD family transcriptional regulator
MMKVTTMRDGLTPAVPDALTVTGRETGFPTDPLTPRERDVLGLIGQGMKSAAVAQALGVSKRTVDFHLDNVYAKLGVRHRMAALCEATRRGISLDGPFGSS